MFSLSLSLSHSLPSSWSPQEHKDHATGRLTCLSSATGPMATAGVGRGRRRQRGARRNAIIQVLEYKTAKPLSTVAGGGFEPIQFNSIQLIQQFFRRAWHASQPHQGRRPTLWDGLIKMDQQGKRCAARLGPRLGKLAACYNDKPETGMKTVHMPQAQAAMACRATACRRASPCRLPEQRRQGDDLIQRHCIRC